MRLTGWCGQQPGVRVSREDSKDFGTDIPCEARNQGLTLAGGMGRLQLTSVSMLLSLLMPHSRFPIVSLRKGRLWQVGLFRFCCSLLTLIWSVSP